MRVVDRKYSGDKKKPPVYVLAEVDTGEKFEGGHVKATIPGFYVSIYGGGAPLNEFLGKDESKAAKSFGEIYANRSQSKPEGT